MAKNPLRLDPSRTTMLRKSFLKEIRKRFHEIKRDVLDLVVEQDVFGLKESSSNGSLVMHASGVEKQAWRFATSDQKLKNFHKWFRQQTNKGVLQVDIKGKPWTAKYVDSAYKKGVTRSFIDGQKRKDLDKPLDFTQGTREQFLRSSFNKPERVSKLAMVSTRIFEDLNGITTDMGAKIGRHLAKGLAEGKHPRDIARSMAEDIDKLTRTRAEVIARTEIIAAHAEGQLDGFQDLGIEEVGLQAEWVTARDDRVCEECEPLDGVVMSVDEARGLIPRHPNCRCTWVPALESRKEKGQVRLKSQVQKQIKKSMKAETGAKTAKDARTGSDWVGKEIVRRK